MTNICKEVCGVKADECGLDCEAIKKIFFDKIDDRKCCGNCVYRTHMDMGNHVDEWCYINHYVDSSSCSCKKHEFDNLSKKDREIFFKKK